MNRTKKAHLVVQVIQNGSLQFEKAFSKPLWSQKIKVGSKKQDGIWIPFCLFHKSVDLFSLNSQNFFVLIDPRFEGFLTTPDGFRRISEIVAPKGSLTSLASPTDPKKVPLPIGSRGGLKLYGYEILFKVDHKKKLYKKSFKGIGIPRQLLPWPHTDAPLEKGGVLLGIVSMALIFLPVLVWLLKGPVHQIGSLKDFPTALLAQFVAPDHFRYLPAIYGSKYNQKTAPLQAYQWIQALQKRWDPQSLEPENRTLSQQGDDTIGFPIIDGFQVPKGPETSGYNFGILVRNMWKIGQSQKPSYLMPVPFFYTNHSGGDHGTLRFRQKHRLTRLQTTYTAIKSQILTEHQFLKNHFSKQNAKINNLFGFPEPDGPKVIGQEPPQIDGEFLQERLRFQDGESWAKYTENNGIYRKLWATKEEKKLKDEKSLQLAPSTEILPYSHVSLGGGPANPFASLEHNLEYSMGYRKFPAPPQPRPTINMQEVALVLFGKREQMRMCYELSLRRNPRMAGDVHVGWTVRLDGRVANVKALRTQIRDGLFLKCLEQRLESWRFPRPVYGPVYLKHTFGFVSSNGTNQDLKE